MTVSLQPSFAIQWLVPRLVKFSERHPDIDVRIKAVDLDEGSLTDDVDVAIYYGRGNWPGLRSDKLHTEYLIPVCSPAADRAQTAAYAARFDSSYPAARYLPPRLEGFGSAS